MLMTNTTEQTRKHDHLAHLCRFLEQIDLEEYYTLIVTKLKVRDRKKEKLPMRSGNITFDQVLKVARLMEDEGKSNSTKFEGTVK